MRLTHLKLAGFKSFVDPTTLHIHGQRVGVVGPNGCGKSNVMESVRWVLGESSAKELRGDSMDAVIFNGSSNRKPISRASVELVFDNSFVTSLRQRYEIVCTSRSPSIGDKVITCDDFVIPRYPLSASFQVETFPSVGM